jgi:YD repeat-containing protein
MPINFKFKSSIIFVILCLQIVSTKSQYVYPPKIVSPNVASLGTFGDVPVSLFTGTPDISVPIHTLSYGKIEIPIALRYHPSSVKPGQQPGWVGSGWDLESIGSITRQIHGTLDEEYIDGTVNPAGQTPPTATYYYPLSPGAQTATPGANYANLSNWSSSTQLNSDYYNTSIPPLSRVLDVHADEFTFNVMGHSGKFYYEGTTQLWKVVSDENIKVEMIDFFTAADIVNAIKQYYKGSSGSLQQWPDQSRSFGSFRLTMPDGTVFVFGGRTSGVPDAVEFTSPLIPIGSNSQDQTFVANTWLLKSITDVYGNTVSFTYSRKYPTINMSIGAYYNSLSTVSTPPLMVCSATCSSDQSFSLDYNVKNKYIGVLQWPMYLTTISSPNETAKFICSKQIWNKYTVPQMSYVDQTNSSVLFDFSLFGATPGCLDSLQWMQLDSVDIYDNRINSTFPYPNLLKQYQFTYLNSSSSPNQRLMLGAFKELDIENNVVGQYTFGYNGDLSSANIGLTGANIYATGNFSDHWGFYNATDVTVAPVDLLNHRQPNSSVVTKELLNQITYPTGGHTTFTWEANDYSQVVDPLRQKLNPQTGYAGGSRIARIQNILADGTVATDKSYYYKTGYTAGANLGSLPSSGELNGNPQYQFTVSNRQAFQGPSTTVSFTLYAFNGVGNYGYTGQGSPIGYSEVDEVALDGSFTKNNFTNFDADINGVTHFDQQPPGYLGWVSGDYYFPFTSFELERGKAIGTFRYSATNIPLQKEIITYRSDAARLNSYINLIDDGGMYGCVACTVNFNLASARPVYTYCYYPMIKTITTWDQQGNNPLTQTTSFTYNANNLIQSTTDQGSKGESIVNSFSYPTDFSDGTSVAMANAHIFTPLLQHTILNNGTQVKMFKTNYYSPYAGIYLPQTNQIQISNNALETRDQVNQYDAHGHIQEVQKINNIKEVYLWGYNSQYIVAKIINSTYSAVQAAMNANSITQSQLDQAVFLTSSQLNTLLNPLRTSLSGALVTTYSYKCGIGLATETDPNNRIMTYEYDYFGRLFNVRDQDNNVIKKYCYNYAGMPESCTIVGNAINIQTYTKTCPPYNTASTGTYTVAANTYYNYSLQLANNMAAADQAANGQTTVNKAGTCTPWPSMSVSVATGGANPTRIFSVTFYQGATVVATQTFTSNGSMPVPPGTYKVVVSQINNISRSIYLSISGGQSGITVTFNNVVVSSGFNMTVN